MPAVLIATRNQTHLKKSVLGQGEFFIGRSHECGLALDDKAVSRRHAVIRCSGNRYEIEDLSSRNGTSVNGERIAGRRVLAEKDLITIGPFEMRFHQSEHEAEPVAPGQEPHSETMAVDAASLKKMTGDKSARAAGSQGGARGGSVAKVAAVEGPLKGTVFDAWSDALTFGRSGDSDVVIPDEAASQHHARIVRQGAAFAIEDLGSSNGTFVQGGRIQRHELKNGQRIRIATSTFVFTQVDPVRQRTFRMAAAVILLFLALLAGVAKLTKPVDQSQILTTRGWEEFKQARYQEASDFFEKALVINPANAEAKQGIESARRESETLRQIVQAKQLAEKEQFDEAMAVCYEVLRLKPDHPEAKQLEGIIQSIGEARVAVDARNWKDAMHLLAAAHKTYPGSGVVQALNDRARSEAESQEHLTKAKEFISFGQNDAARERLQKIPERSVYFPEAKALTANAETAAVVVKAQQNAQQAFRDGDVAAALGHLDAGLKADSGNPELRRMKDAFSAVVPLAQQLDASASVFSSSDIQQVRSLQEVCRKLAACDSDPRNKFRIRAEETHRRLDEHLKAIGRTAAAEAEGLFNAGDLRGALLAYRRAHQADASNEAAKRQADAIQTRITEECRKHFQKAVVHEELDQLDLAIEAYQNVLKIAIPGESYHERAKDKVTALQRRK